MTKATWNGATIAESDKTIRIEGNHYFPADSVDMSLLQASDKTTECFWKGTATYYDIVVDGNTNPDAAWTYKTPMDGSVERVGQDFSGHIAFWAGVEVA